MLASQELHHQHPLLELAQHGVKVLGFISKTIHQSQVQ
jgi:hypothetical protein